MHNPLKGEKKQPPIRKNIPYYKYTYLYIYFYLFLSFLFFFFFFGQLLYVARMVVLSTLNESKVI
jgi:hypothetical protein